MKTAEDSTKLWVTDRIAEHGPGRDNLLTNPGTLFQVLAQQFAMCRAIARSELDPSVAKVFEVGCASGTAVPLLIQLGFEPNRIYGMDLIPKNIDLAQRRFPNCHFIAGNAAKTPYSDSFFDLALESGVFLQTPDDEVSGIAREMVRVLKPGGYVLLIDWRYGHPRREHYRLSGKRIARLFAGEQRIAAVPGALVPPIGRALSAHASGLYFAVQRLVLPVVGQYAWLLRKSVSAGKSPPISGVTRCLQKT
jgi:SAM-dependent methyltransferase